MRVGNLGVDELPPLLWHFDRPVFVRGLLCWRSVDQEMAPLFEAPKRQETSSEAAEHPVRRQLAKYRDAPRGGSGSLERRERGVANVDRLTRIQGQATESGRHPADIGELRKG